MICRKFYNVNTTITGTSSIICFPSCIWHSFIKHICHVDFFGMHWLIWFSFCTVCPFKELPHPIVHNGESVQQQSSSVQSSNIIPHDDDALKIAWRYKSLTAQVRIIAFSRFLWIYAVLYCLWIMQWSQHIFLFSYSGSLVLSGVESELLIFAVKL